jgi:hypothetical protein
MHSVKTGVPSITVRTLLAATASLLCTSTTTNALVQVDTELLFLVEVSKDIDATTFGSVMRAYGNALTNSAIINDIQKGQIGKIAASVVFWSDQNDQVVGVNWMEISNSTTAQNFSNQLLSLSLPFNKPKNTAIAPAIDFAIPLFGTETGGAENGFSSITQIIDVAGFNVDDGSKNKSLRGDTLIPAATKAALAAGVDMINGVVIGDTSGTVADYYNSFVIGGSSSTVSSAPNIAALNTTLLQMLTQEVRIGALASNAAVPETSSSLLAVCSLLLFYRRR